MKVILLYIPVEASVQGNTQVSLPLSLVETSCQEELKPPDSNKDVPGRYSSKILHSRKSMFSTGQGSDLPC